MDTSIDTLRSQLEDAISELKNREKNLISSGEGIRIILQSFDINETDSFREDLINILQWILCVVNANNVVLDHSDQDIPEVMPTDQVPTELRDNKNPLNIDMSGIKKIVVTI